MAKKKQQQKKSTQSKKNAEFSLVETVEDVDKLLKNQGYASETDETSSRLVRTFTPSLSSDENKSASSVSAKETKVAAKPVVNLRQRGKKGRAVSAKWDSETERELQRLTDAAEQERKALKYSGSWLPEKYRWATPYATGGVIFLIILAILLLKLGEGDFLSKTADGESVSVNPYSVLGVARDASSSQIRKSYRGLSLKYHPDKAPADCVDCNEKFQKISVAYKILSDPESRRTYDETGYSHVSVADEFASGYGKDEGPLTTSFWHTMVKPSIKRGLSAAPVNPSEVDSVLSPTGVWLVLVARPQAASTSHILGLWKEVGDRLVGLASMARVSPDDSSFKYLTLGGLFPPAVVLIRPNMPHEIFSAVNDFDIERFMTWFADRYPAIETELVDVKGAMSALQQYKNRRSTWSFKLGSVEDLRTPIFYVSHYPVPHSYRAAFLRLRDTFKFYHVDEWLMDEMFGDQVQLSNSRAGTIFGVSSSQKLVSWPVRSESNWLRHGKSASNEAVEHREQVMKDFLSFAQNDALIPLDQRDYHKWCTSTNESVRVFCVFVNQLHEVNDNVVVSNNTILDFLTIVNSHKPESKLNYDEEYVEVDDSEAEERDENEDISPDLRTSRIQKMSLVSDSPWFRGSTLGNVWKTTFRDAEWLIYDFETGLLTDKKGSKVVNLNDLCNDAHRRSCMPLAPNSISEVFSSFMS